MKKFSFDSMPTLRMLDNNAIEEIHEGALDILENCGIHFDRDEAINILENAGCSVNHEKNIAKFPRDLVMKSISTVPDTVKLYDRDGNLYRELGGNKTNFYPGSCPKNMLDADGFTSRPAMAQDMKNIAKIAEYTPQLDFVSC
ncbi:MAG: trimethylamine methyltransferase family protein, partial [Clostridiales bacterium]